MSRYTLTKRMFPRLTLDQLAQKIEQSPYLINNSKPQATISSGNNDNNDTKFPSIPPRSTKDLHQLPDKVDAEWYMIVSPREIKGVAGPFPLEKLQKMYKSGEITNSTLFWRNGEDDWEKLQYIESLKRTIIQLPVIPPRVGTYDAERKIFDPIVDLPTANEIKTAVMLDDDDVDKYNTRSDINKACAICGSIAIAHIPTQKPPIPDLYKCRIEIGATNDAAEILPGFLFVGSQSSAKMRSLKRLGITLIINSTSNLSNPEAKLPFYRCKDAPLMESPPEVLDSNDVHRLIELMDKVYDWIERHRLHPELEEHSDPIITEHYRGPTDTYGRPIKTAAERQVFRRPKKEEKETSLFPPRVLIWSRLGCNRSCVLAASYLIRHYNMSLDLALKIMKSNRIDMKIDAGYLHLLKEWSRKYSLGKLLCKDCLSSSIEIESHEKLKVENEQKMKSNRLSNNHSNQYLVDKSEDKLKNLSAKLNSSTTKKTDAKAKEDSVKIADINQYLIKLASHNKTIMINGILQYQWSGLFDIELSCRQLSDVTIATLVSYLSECNLIRGLRSLKLQSNLISNLAIKQLLVSFYPYGCTSDGDFKFDEFQLVTEVDNNFELMILDLSNNRIDEFGTQYLYCFLKLCNSLVYLDISNNNLDDFCCTDLIHAISRPAEDFDHEEKPTEFGKISYGHSSAGEVMRVHNHSITDLNIGFNELGDSSAEALINMIKNNAVLRTLHLNLCTSISPINFRKIANAMRLYNSTLQELSFADTPLSVKTVEYFARVMESKDTQISKLDFSNCNLRYQHLKALQKYIYLSKDLKNLNVSGNKLSDTGAIVLASIIEGEDSFNPMTGTINRQPPLTILDISSCDFKSDGCKVIVRAVSTRNNFKLLNLSNNYFGSDNIDGFEALSQCAIHDLWMNVCSINSHGAAILFNNLSNCNNNVGNNNRLSRTLKVCSLSGNGISDSAMTAFGRLLENNNVIECIDLGFNNITDQSLELLKKCSSVASTDTAEKKFYNLTVHLFGNKCNPFAIGPPGLARSKYNFNFGTRPNPLDPLNKGYSHIPSVSRGHFLARKELDNIYKVSYQLQTINNIE